MMNESCTILALSDIKKEFESPAKDVAPLLILDDITFSIASGTSVAITGKSGCGKSTLLHIAAGLENPTAGSILFRGDSIVTMNDAKKSSLRNKKMGFIFQSNLLLEDFTAIENVMMPAMIAGCKKKEAKARAMDLLQRVGVADRLDHRPEILSGGERQRIAIARALMNAPELIFADEPTGSLDEENAALVEELLLGLVDDERCALMLVTHNLHFARRCDTVFLLRHRTLEALT